MTRNSATRPGHLGPLVRGWTLLGLLFLGACQTTMGKQSLILYPEDAAHPVFHLERLQDLWDQHPHQDWGSAEEISTIWDLLALEVARRECGAVIGEGIPTDVFIMVPGEPRNPAGTKVGGRPFWPKGKPWPVSEGGERHEFLAQFNFMDSKDIYPSLPGDILVVTLDRHGQEYPEETPSTWWFSAEEVSDPTIEVASFEGARTMHGVRYRGLDYPAAVAMVNALDDERSDECYMTPAFNATKIGGLPVFVQTGIGSEFHCLGQLTSLHLPPAVPFSPPSLPDGYPASLDDNPFSPKYWPYNYGDAGTFNFILDDKGALYVLFETH